MKEMINMRKIWKIFGIGMLIAITATASAFGYQNSVYANSGVQNEDLLQKAYELLENAEVREVQSYANTHYLLIVNGETAGVLWKNVNLEDIKIGEPFVARWGAKAPLLVGEEVVGQIFIEGRPFGWMHANNANNANNAANSENGYGWHGNGNCSQETQYGSQNGYGHMHGHENHRGEGYNYEYCQHGQYSHNHGHRGEMLGWQNSMNCELYGYPGQGR